MKGRVLLDTLWANTQERYMCCQCRILKVIMPLTYVSYTVIARYNNKDEQILKSETLRRITKAIFIIWMFLIRQNHVILT